MSKTLVTGGAGFIGSHLCAKLLKAGKKVICLDNLLTGTYENISGLCSNPDFEYIQADVTDPLAFDVDEIYNLACPASPIQYQQDPIRTAKTSFLGALNVLELARKNGAKVLQSSTSEIYGDPVVHPQREDYRGNVNTLGPRACYDEGKRIAETLFSDFRRFYGVNTKIIRIFNTYGPHMLENDGRVVSNFIIQALKGEPLTVYGDGTQTRSFCYVDDLVRGIMAMMEAEDASGPVNLGNPQEITVLHLAEMIIRKTGSSSRLLFEKLPEDDPCRRKPDITLAKRLLGWQPQMSIEEGLDETIAYFRGRCCSYAEESRKSC